MEKVRKHFIFQGYVQGVGFRYRAYRAAESRGITGWVRNCWDGSVEMEAEGTERDIDDLIEVLKSHIWGSIDDMISEHIPVRGDHVFEIV